MIKELEANIAQIDKQIAAIDKHNATAAQLLMLSQLKRNKKELLSAAKNNLKAEDRVYLARHPQRPNTMDYISALFKDFFPLCGDRQCADDQSIVGGLALYHGVPVTIIGHRKGRSLEENLKYNFGMPNPEGYRKARRLMEQAEKFGRPVITFIDTPGAYPGIEAEARGQGEAIAQCLMAMGNLKVPVISVVIGEGGSGGALAIGVADTLIMLENAVFSVLSPEGFASILWKDSTRSGEACEIMKLTAKDLKEFGIADKVISEPAGGAQRDATKVYAQLDSVINKELNRLRKLSGSTLVHKRYQKLRAIGSVTERRTNDRN